MKYALLLALVTIAGSAHAQQTNANSAQRVPLPSPINSIGLQGNPGNVSVPVNVNGIREVAGPSGIPIFVPYTIRSIALEGRLMQLLDGSYAREAVIRVKPPGAASAFYVQPFTQARPPATSLPLSFFHAAVPVAPISSAETQQGPWTLTYEESFDDNSILGVDAVWEGLVFHTYDFTINPPAPNGNPGIQLTGLDSVSTTPSTVIGFSYGVPNSTFNAFRISGIVTSLTNATANNTANTTTDVRVRVIPPSGVPSDLAPVVLGVNSRSSTVVDLTSPLFSSFQGNWTIQIFEQSDTPGVVDNRWENLRFEFVTVPAPASSINLGTLTTQPVGSPESILSRSSSQGSSIQWFRFTTEAVASASTGYYVDIDTVGTVSQGAVVDTEIALYSSRGELIAEDDDNGPDRWSMLTFGSAASRPALPATFPATNIGQPRNGNNGDLAPGTHYVAHITYDGRFAPLFVVTNSTDPVSRTLNLRTNMRATPALSPCGIADVGSEGGAASSDSILDNNDFVAFISLFFNSDPRADIGSEGAATASDGNWDNNDFIVFINAFFDGQSASGCNGNP